MSKSLPITKNNFSSQDFYQFYLAEHHNIHCRRLHFLGSTFGVFGLAMGIKKHSLVPVIKGVAVGYSCAWIGHFFFEKNKPATFKYPVRSFMSDWRMYGDMWRGKISLKNKKPTE